MEISLLPFVFYHYYFVVSLLCRAHTLKKQQTLLTEVSQSPHDFTLYLVFDIMGGRCACVCMC